jgi:hypothetical protein
MGVKGSWGVIDFSTTCGFDFSIVEGLGGSSAGVTAAGEIDSANGMTRSSAGTAFDASVTGEIGTSAAGWVATLITEDTEPPTPRGIGPSTGWLTMSSTTGVIESPRLGGVGSSTVRSVGCGMGCGLNSARPPA